MIEIGLRPLAIPTARDALGRPMDDAIKPYLRVSGEAGDPFRGGGKQHPVPGLAGADAQPDREVGSCRCLVVQGTPRSLWR